MKPLYFARQMKNGTWRLYQIVQQALIAWRGCNDKTSVVRSANGRILTFNSFESADAHCQQEFKVRCLTEKDVES